MPKPADPLEYYAGPGPITDPGEYVGLFEGLPTGVPALCQVVQGVMIHRDSANWRGVQLTEKQKQDADLRHVARLLARIHEVDDRPLTIPRPLEKRLAITCRDFATVLCAMLRRQGAPARAAGLPRILEDRTRRLASMLTTGYASTGSRMNADGYWWTQRLMRVRVRTPTSHSMRATCPVTSSSLLEKPGSCAALVKLTRIALDSAPVPCTDCGTL